MKGTTPVPRTLVVTTFDQEDPQALGRAHGESWRAEIEELAEIRLELLVRQGGLGDRGRILEIASSHLPVLQRCAPELLAELEGIAEGAGVALERLVVLNHYTDLRDLDPTAAHAEPGGCTAIYIVGDQGPVLGQTWDMHASAEPFVRLMRIQPRGSYEETLCFTLTGCLALAGLGHGGVAVTINNLCLDTRIGLLWPALVRLLLRQPSAAAAYALLRDAPVSGGRHFMIADGRDFFGVECSGSMKVLTQKGAKAAHLHTNHCFDPVLRKHERPSSHGTSFERMNLASTLYAQLRPRSLEALWDLLASHDGYPRSICSHLHDASGDSSMSRTCGLLVMELETGRVRAAPGCGREGRPLEAHVERYLRD